MTIIKKIRPWANHTRFGRLKLRQVDVLAVRPDEDPRISQYPYEMRVRLFVTITALFLLSGCQTARYREFENVHGGMSKSDVLATVGNPDRTQRWYGRDRWQYTLYGTPDGTIDREVHFENGVATYVGAAIKPAISAADQDRINEEKNRQADLREAPIRPDENGFIIQRFKPVDADDDSPKSATAP